MNKIFQLNFLGPADSSSATLDTIKKMFADNFGLTEEQVETILLNSPVTLIESNNKEELLPTYEFLRSTPVQIVIEEFITEANDTEENDEDFSFNLDEQEENDPTEDSEEATSTTKIPEQIVIEEFITEADDTEENDEDFSFNLDEQEENDPTEDSEKTTSTVNTPEEEDFSFDFHSEDDCSEEIKTQSHLAKPIEHNLKVEEHTIFSFDEDKEETIVSPPPTAPARSITKNHHEHIGLAFESDKDDETPHLANVHSAPLKSVSISSENQGNSPVLSSAMKLNFDIKPKDQIFLEQLEQKKAEESVEINDDEIELKDGPIEREDAFKDSGFDNKLHSTNYAKKEFVAPKKTLFKKEYFQYLIPILIGCAVVVFGTISILPTPKEPEVIPMINQIEDHKITKTKETPAIISNKYYGKSEEKNMIVEGTLTRYNDELRNITLSVTPPAPQALTPEDLVSNKKLPPWVEKLTLEQFNLNPSKDDKSFLGVTKARIFVNYDQTKYRLIVPVAVRAILNKEANSVRVAVIMKLGIKNPPDLPFMIEVGTGGQHKMYLKSVFEATEVKESSESEAVVPPEENK